jgi:hypothetical protein
MSMGTGVGGTIAPDCGLREGDDLNPLNAIEMDGPSNAGTFRPAYEFRLQQE